MVNNEKYLHYLSQSIVLEEATNPKIIRTTIFIVAILVVVMIIWMSITKVSETTKTAGEVIPSGYVQKIQHLDGGIVSKILVKNGDIVKKGQSLLILDDTNSEESLKKEKIKQIFLKLQYERINAILAQKTPNFKLIAANYPDLCDSQQQIFDIMQASYSNRKQIITTQLNEKKQELEKLKSSLANSEEMLNLNSDELDTQKKLLKQGHSDRRTVFSTKINKQEALANYQKTKFDVTQSELVIIEYEQRIAAIEYEIQKELLDQLENIEKQTLENNETIEHLTNRIKRLSVASPIYGIVTGLNLNTIGAVVSPGQTILEIVPIEKKLFVEVKIYPSDIGSITIGMPATINVDAYDFSKYGQINGRIEYLSATTFTSEKDPSVTYYKGRISLEKNYVDKIGKQYFILPGMTVQANIITGENSIIAYLLKPINITLSNALSER